ncbi:RIP metalloprotease RseP [Aerococcus sanguinicola]|uniref:Zinc metalloprotease n=1 Tax=Aerococcus sanguinicola TaxID=119206 RepID=A0A0X8FDV0_9LACT|nr:MULTISPECIES: RIP metalloprotease RseP [Aerococcus]AMB94717.1 metalloprotease RseP [Aerococcus sanguinicola]MDK7050930.1 RIP metalloprotease RseP [Aerococcus sanguinicola]OFT96468.1 metalloprotease RseP [Aerococcus sp. HMSC23C02]PKZ23281.1 RIP metalloprotease RseP [Aerococcus sanguinicola]
MKTIITFLLIFSVIVIFHEFGHFFFAKRAGILVREFAIGMGPKLYQYQGEETTYTIRLLPIGGYVRMAGLEEMADSVEAGMQLSLTFNEAGKVSELSLAEEDLAAEALPVEVVTADLDRDLSLQAIPYGEREAQTYVIDRQADFVEADGTRLKIAPYDRQFQSASIPQRLMTNFAGPMNNFILGILAFTVLAFVQGGVPSSEAIVGEVVDGSPAQASHLQTGDQIQTINGQEVASFADMQAKVSSSEGKPLEVTYERQGQEMTTQLQPKEVDYKGQKIYQIGVGRFKDSRFLAKLTYGFKASWAMITGILTTLVGMFKNGFNINQFGGPVFMYQATGEVVNQGWIAIMSWTAMLSLNLGVVNLLPVPALDGGKILFNIIEAVLGRPVDQKVEGIINLAGAALLFILMIAVTWNDIQRLF